MPKKISEEEFDAAQRAVKEVDRRIEEDKKRESSELLVQEISFSPDSENEQRIEELEGIIAELRGHLLSRIKKVEEDVENLKKGRRGGKYA